MKPTITLNHDAIVGIAEALGPQIERIIDDRLRLRDANFGAGGRRLLRANSVMQLTGLKRSTIYRDPTFPKQIKISERAVAWDQQEVLDWIEARKASR